MVSKNNNIKVSGNNNTKIRDRDSFLSHLAHRWADVIEMIKCAEPGALKSLDLSGLARIAWAEQLGDEGEFVLKNSLIAFSNYLKNHLHVVYCRPVVDDLIRETEGLNRQTLSTSNASGFFSIASQVPNESLVSRPLSC